MRSLWILMGLVVACGGGEDERHPASPAAGGATAKGGSSSKAGSSPKPSAGEAGSGEPEGGAGGEGGAMSEPPIIYEMGGLPQNMPGICDPALQLGEAEPQQLAVPGATLLAMTPDELSVAFTTGSGGTLALYVADRASIADDFVELLLIVPDGYHAAHGVTLSSDALRLILPRDDDDGFAELTRAERGAAFGLEPSEARFGKLNDLKLTTGNALGWPVLSSDGKALYFISSFGEAVGVVSTLGDNDTFNAGVELDPYTLGGDDGKRTLISGLASDERAMFYVDEATKHAMARFRSRPGSPFYDPLDLGERQGVVPNEDCSRIYSTVAGELLFQSSE